MCTSSLGPARHGQLTDCSVQTKAEDETLWLGQWVAVRQCLGCKMHRPCTTGRSLLVTLAMYRLSSQCPCLPQANVREKTKQLQAMAGELNMYQAQVNEYKYEIDRLTRELNDTKRRYFEQKRQEQLAKSKKPGLIAAKPGAVTADMATRYTGGGFALTASIN